MTQRRHSRTGDHTSYPSRPARGYFAQIYYEHQGGFEHWLGGEQDTAQCPNCRKPMLLLMSLDARDPRMDMGQLSLRRLPLMFCWTCTQAEIAYSLGNQGEFAMLAYRKSTPNLNFPYNDYPLSFEALPLRLIPIPPDVQRAIAAVNEGREDDWESLAKYLDLDVPTHQIGGMPYLVQHNVEEQVACPRCGNNAPFLAAVGDDSGGDKGFTGNRFVQVVFHFCRTCCVVLAYQRCD